MASRRTGIPAALVALALATGCGSSAPPEPLTFEASVPLSADESSPAVTDAPTEVRLTFAEPLDGSTVAGSVELATAVPGADWVADPPTDVSWAAGRPAEVIVRTRDGLALPKGHAFRLSVGAGLRSATGKALASPSVGYFATDNPSALVEGTVAGPLGARRDIYVVSDVHMGDERSIEDHPLPHYGWFVDNRDALQEFLERAGRTVSLRELVIAGDLVDEWVAPMELSAFGDGKTEAEFVDSVARANPGIIAAFRTLSAGPDVRVTYVPGNHDMLVTEADVARLFPGMNQARDVKGLGRYSPVGHDEVVIEHGHRYDFFNAPAPLGNPDVAGSILPPGYFVSKVASTSDRERGRKPGASSPLAGMDTGLTAQSGSEYAFYTVAWAAILIAKTIDPPGMERTIATGIDGFTASYPLTDLVPHFVGGQLEVNVYEHIETKWPARAEANGVTNPVDMRVAIANSAVNRLLDVQSAWQYFVPPGTGKRIVVFGHTHDVRLDVTSNDAGKACIYANSGTWIDAHAPESSLTFVSIVPPHEGSDVTVVTTWRFVRGGGPVKLASAAIRVPAP